MFPHDSREKTPYVLKDLSTAELKALIDQFPGGKKPDYAFLSALLDEYASRPEVQSIAKEADAAQARLMATLGLNEYSEKPVVRKKHPRLSAALVAAILVVALLGITAFADSSGFISAASHTITESAWFQAVFGNSAIKGTEANDWQVPYKEDVLKRPAMERVSVDEELADKLLGPQMVDIDKAVTIGGYTFTFQSFVMDENGLGVLTYTMENHDGLQALRIDEDYKTFSFDLEDGIVSPNIYFELISSNSPTNNQEQSLGEMGEGSALIDDKSFLAEGGSDTEKQVIAYLGSFDDPGKYDTLRINCSSFELPHSREELTLDVPLSDLVPAAAFCSEDGSMVQVSPLGIRVSSPIFEKHHGQNISNQELVIHFDDGSEYVAVSDQQFIDNTTVGLLTSDWNGKYGFSRLVEPEKITAVTLSGLYDDGTVIDLYFIP